MRNEMVMERAVSEDRMVRLEIWIDDDMESPREWDPFGHMVCWHRRYALGDEHAYKTPEEFYYHLAGELGMSDDYRERLYEEEVWGKDDENPLRDWVLNHPDLLILPLYLYDHGGITISTSSTRFQGMDSYGWDWGQVGWTYATRREILQEYSRQRMSKELWERARKLLVAEVETYDLYARGLCYGFTLERAAGTLDAEHLDSCGGFLGWLDEVKEEMKEHVADEYRYLFDEAA